jgi:hypothetical protein
LTIETITPLTIRVNGEVRRLRAGERLKLPEEKGRKLLERAPGRVRMIPCQHDWDAEWRTLATVTDGMLPHDSRLQPTLAALSQCDDAFLRNDWTTFQRLAQEIHRIVGTVPP